MLHAPICLWLVSPEATPLLLFRPTHRQTRVAPFLAAFRERDRRGLLFKHNQALASATVLIFSICTLFRHLTHFQRIFLSFRVGPRQGESFLSLPPYLRKLLLKLLYIFVCTWFLILRYLWWVLHGFSLLPRHCYGCFFFSFCLVFSAGA